VIGAQASVEDLAAGLDSANARVQHAALIAIRRLKIEGLEDRVLKLVLSPDPDVAIAAACALASRGRTTPLEQIVMKGGIPGAVAAEALERFRVGRLQW
jgi:HEAT repeat protein